MGHRVTIFSRGAPGRHLPLVGVRDGLASAAPAGAVVDPGDPSPDVLGICQGDLPQSVQEAGQLYLPVNRWGGLGSIHKKLSWNPVGGDWGSKIQRNGVITPASH